MPFGSFRNLEEDYPVVDRIRDGRLLSVKRHDLLRSVYRDPANLLRVICHDIDLLADFVPPARWGRTNLLQNGIRGRQLNLLLLGRASMSDAMRRAVDEARAYGASRGVRVELVGGSNGQCR